MNSKTAGPKRDRLAEVVRVMVNSINKLVRCRHIDEDCMQGTCSQFCKGLVKACGGLEQGAAGLPTASRARPGPGAQEPAHAAISLLCFQLPYSTYRSQIYKINLSVLQCPPTIPTNIFYHRAGNSRSPPGSRKTHHHSITAAMSSARSCAKLFSLEKARSRQCSPGRPSLPRSSLSWVASEWVRRLIFTTSPYLICYAP